MFSCSSGATRHHRWARGPCYQQLEKGSWCFRRASYIDDIKVVLRRKAINASVVKSAFRIITLALKGSCEDKHCVRKKVDMCEKIGAEI